ncbi:hypothetical protein [Virgibacillus salinus]|uniref:hypothetical protein n=1 Tax=Virgibacillus salinus TaxID=553311 RepID=UPI000B809B00|nr:hypothetical protein [Virgibacillus salinus]
MNLIKVFRSYDYQKLARLNEVVHNLHVKLYPRYFTPYNYSEMEVEFEKLIRKLGLSPSLNGESLSCTYAVRK